MKAGMPHAGAPVSSTRAMVRERMLVEVVDDGEVPLTVEEEALLLRQCRLNKVELVEKTIDSGKIGPNFEFSNGDTVLIIACKCGYKKLAVRVPAKAKSRQRAILARSPRICECACAMARRARHRVRTSLLTCTRLGVAACRYAARCKHGSQGPRGQHSGALGLCDGFQGPGGLPPRKRRQRQNCK